MRTLFTLLSTLMLATSALAFQTPGAPPTIEEALATPADLQFGDANPADAAEWLAKRYRINVFVDQRALADRERAGIRLRASAKAETLAEALTKLLQPHKMKWKVEHDVLWLTADDDFDWVTHVYRAADAAAAKAWCTRLPREYASWPENARVLYAICPAGVFIVRTLRRAADAADVLHGASHRRGT
jgi:hypothetical protein